MDSPAVLSISYTESTIEMVDRMLSTLGVVILVLIVSAGMLAFVVLYNLNNINITERQRELATLKVLGFFDIRSFSVCPAREYHSDDRRNSVWLRIWYPAPSLYYCHSRGGCGHVWKKHCSTQLFVLCGDHLYLFSCGKHLYA